MYKCTKGVPPERILILMGSHTDFIIRVGAKYSFREPVITQEGTVLKMDTQERKPIFFVGCDRVTLVAGRSPGLTSSWTRNAGESLLIWRRALLEWRRDWLSACLNSCKKEDSCILSNAKLLTSNAVRGMHNFHLIDQDPNTKDINMQRPSLWNESHFSDSDQIKTLQIHPSRSPHLSKYHIALICTRNFVMLAWRDYPDITGFKEEKTDNVVCNINFSLESALEETRRESARLSSSN